MSFESIPWIDEPFDGLSFEIVSDRCKDGSSVSRRGREIRLRPDPRRLEFAEPGIASGMIERPDPVEQGLDAAVVFTMDGHLGDS